MNAWKIRRKSDGLFSTGGCAPVFNKNGKVWKRRCDLSNHINLVSKKSYRNCEVVEFELLETCSWDLQVEFDLAQAREDKREQERIECRIRYQQERINRLQDELDKLRAENQND